LSGRTFAASLIDLVVPDDAGETTINKLTQRVDKLHPAIPAKPALLALLRDAGTNVDSFRRGLENWYDEQMGRVSGWYKRWAQRRLLEAGLSLAILVNIDSVQVAQTLYRDQPVRDAVVAQATSAVCAVDEARRVECEDDQEKVLRNLPLPMGWDLSDAVEGCRAYSTNGCPQDAIPFLFRAATDNGLDGMLLKLLGWLVTGVAVSFGAPFWFDSLSKLGSLRTAGRRPGENSPFEAPPVPTPSPVER
jgi:hypothetical protein